MEEVERPIEERQVVAVPRLIISGRGRRDLGDQCKDRSQACQIRQARMVKVTARGRRFTEELIEQFVLAETYYRDPVHFQARASVCHQDRPR